MNNVLKDCHHVIDDTLSDVDRAIKIARSGKSKQITKADDLDYFKALAYSWFHSRYPQLNRLWANIELEEINDCFTTILNATAKRAARSTYQTSLRNARKQLIETRGKLVSGPSPTANSNNDAPPDFSHLVADSMMQQILLDRWRECQTCVNAGAYLAATVMMGGLLEALFVAYANRLPDKSAMFAAKSVPMDSQTKKPLQLSQWTLRPYIDVGHELGWITRSGKDVAEVLRDYRNYVHPEKQRSHGITLGRADAEMFWDVTKHIAKQLLAHAKS